MDNGPAVGIAADREVSAIFQGLQCKQGCARSRFALVHVAPAVVENPVAVRNRTRTRELCCVQQTNRIKLSIAVRDWGLADICPASARGRKNAMGLPSTSHSGEFLQAR